MSLSAQTREDLEGTVIRALQIARVTVHNEVVLDNDREKFQSMIANEKILIPASNLLDSENEDMVPYDRSVIHKRC